MSRPKKKVDGVLCVNCGSTKHARCCSYCGKVHKLARLQNDHCSAKCERAAEHANRLSDAMEAAFTEPEEEREQLCEVKQRTLVQCRSCPWRVDCVPERDIPHGYSAKMHETLRKTIASDPDYRPSPDLHVMACHHSKPGEEHHCAGWIHNQLGIGNNIAVRLAVMYGRMPVPEVVGEQHETFDATLPKPKRRRR